jgi:hypothetical protein
MKTAKPDRIPDKKFPVLTKKELTPADISKMIREGGRKFLATLKQKSLRCNKWYRVLSFDKRRFIDAVIQTVDKIRSLLLLKILTILVERLLQAIGGVRALISNLTYYMQNYGQPLAQKISILAKQWGNKTATKWATDKRFIQYLTILDMNNLPIFKASNHI